MSNTNTILIAMKTGIDRRAFADAIATIKELGGKYDASSKLWAVDVDHCLVEMHRRHATEYNAKYPERERWDDTAAGVITDRIGRHAEIVSVEA